MKYSALYNHFRDSYDGHEGVRGRADQTQVSYALLAPLVVAGEESPEESAIRERSMELLFSKRDLKEPSARAAFARITERHSDLTAMGRALLDTALTLRTDAVVQWHREALPMFNAALPSRILNNLACCMVGLRLMEAMLARLGLAWGQVFSVGIDACVKYLEYRENAKYFSTTIAKGWWADANYNTDTYDRIRSGTIKVKENLTANRLIVGDDAGYFVLAAGKAFDIRKPILWCISSGTAGGTTGNCYR